MKVEELLRAHSLKATPTRVEILNCYRESDFALSQLDIENKLESKHDRVTIYRTLASFEEKGILHKVHNPEGPAKYNLCKNNCSHGGHSDHHLHFYCKKCKNSYCLDTVQIPPISLPKQYQLDSVYMVANGVCEVCR